ncbi:MAG TPA: membrane protein insertase YidC, partial [Phycicoccus sp.]|nr:membrane protein insertase YidC [Phycicoccus sp.]
MGDFFNSVLYPIELLVAWIMYGFHSALTTIGMSSGGGWTWALSIVGLVIVMRAAMIPLFVKQIKASRKMQLIQPELQKIQKKYKGKTDPESRQAMTQETMELYRKEQTNPFSSCLPILVQSPFFFGLFRVLNGLQDIADGKRDTIGPITKAVASEAEQATIFGAQLSDHFLGADSLNTQIVTVILIILMSATTFTTQYQLMMKNMPASALDNPFAKQQKIMLYAMPVLFAVSGINFPIGVLIYWFTTNVWSMVQQFYVIRRMPTPGSEAEKALH